jgi:uncharacterized protein YbjQ (UPF0145 family)
MTNPMTSTTFTLDGYRVTRNLGVVRGITVRSRSIFGTIGGSLQTLVTLFTELCEKTRTEAFDMMLGHARDIGANAVVGVRYDATPRSFWAPLGLAPMRAHRNTRRGSVRSFSVKSTLRAGASSGSSSRRSKWPASWLAWLGLAAGFGMSSTQAPASASSRAPSVRSCKWGRFTSTRTRSTSAWLIS